MIDQSKKYAKYFSQNKEDHKYSTEIVIAGHTVNFSEFLTIEKKYNFCVTFLKLFAFFAIFLKVSWSYKIFSEFFSFLPRINNNFLHLVIILYYNSNKYVLISIAGY